MIIKAVFTMRLIIHKTICPDYCLILFAFVWCTVPCLIATENKLSASEDKKFQQCQLCHQIAKDFQAGFDSTKKDNFGGGNTHWEESRLGSYATSEMRLVQIIEKLCHDKTDKEKSKCHSFVEDHEEAIEVWWLKKWAPRQQARSASSPPLSNTAVQDAIMSELCVTQFSLCCPEGHFGPNCVPCAGWNSTSRSICHGHGTCHGNATRVGSGQCQCQAAYQGDTCDTCAIGFYPAPELDSSGQLECQACHASCGSGGCNGPDASNCVDCAAGWSLTPGQGCFDVNECAAAASSEAQAEPNATGDPCASTADTFCENTSGSYVCTNCNVACAPGKGCLGPDANHCRACRIPGYRWDTELNRCEDVDECSSKELEACPLDGHVCTNTPGSFTCACPPDQQEDLEAGACVPKKVPEKEAETDQAEATATETPSTKTDTLPEKEEEPEEEDEEEKKKEEL